MAGVIDNDTWTNIKTAYITSDKSCAELAKEFNVSQSSIEKRCSKEKWKDIRASVCKSAEKILQEKAVEIVVEDNLARIQRVMTLADHLADRIEEALEQLDSYIVKNKRKKTKKTYDLSTGKVASEEVEENEILDVVKGTINTLSVQQLAASLKNVRDILVTPDANQNEEESGVIILAEREEDPDAESAEGDLEATAEAD